MGKMLYKIYYWFREWEATWRSDYNEARYWSEAREELDG